MSAHDDLIESIPAAREGFENVDATLGNFSNTVYVLEEALTGAPPSTLEAARAIVPAVEALRRRVKMLDASLARVLKILEVQT